MIVHASLLQMSDHISTHSICKFLTTYRSISLTNLITYGPILLRMLEHKQTYCTQNISDHTGTNSAQNV